jgi:hypothetical protein
MNMKRKNISDMNIDRKTLIARSWAIPALSGLLILHHDFKTPRLSKVNRLIWSDTSVDVYLQYGVCNVSGNVIDSIDVVVTLNQDGAVGIRMPEHTADDAREGLLQFIAGEVSREALRWTEDMKCWTEDDLPDPDRASILSIVSALVAHPLADMSITIEKDPLNPGCIRKARLSENSLVLEISAFGIHGVNLYLKGHASRAGILRLHQEHDMREEGAQPKNACARFLKDASFGARRLMLLPLDMVLYLCEKRQISEMKMASALVEHLPNSIVDARAGESLSALSN